MEAAELEMYRPEGVDRNFEELRSALISVFSVRGLDLGTSVAHTIVLFDRSFRATHSRIPESTSSSRLGWLDREEFQDFFPHLDFVAAVWQYRSFRATHSRIPESTSSPRLGWLDREEFHDFFPYLDFDTTTAYEQENIFHLQE